MPYPYHFPGSSPKTAIVSLLLVLGAVSITLGAFAWTRTTALYLPLHTSLPAASTFLPLITLLVPIIGSLYNRPSTGPKKKNIKSSPLTTTTTTLLPLINSVLLIAPTVIFTLSITYLVPSETETCGLEGKWQSYFHTKNAPAIRTIQDTLRCCGLRSTRDRAWPFKDGKRYGDDACEVNFGYGRSCLRVWKGEERKVAGLVLGSVLVVFAMKILLHYTITSRPQTSWLSSLRIRSDPETQPHTNGSNPRMIAYRDEEDEGTETAESHHDHEEDENSGQRQTNPAGLQWSNSNSESGHWNQEDSTSAGRDEQGAFRGPAMHPSGLGSTSQLLS